MQAESGNVLQALDAATPRVHRDAYNVAVACVNQGCETTVLQSALSVNFDESWRPMWAFTDQRLPKEEWEATLDHIAGKVQATAVQQERSTADQARIVFMKHVELNGTCSMPDSVDNARACVRAWNSLRMSLNHTRAKADQKPEIPEVFFVNVCMMHVLHISEDRSAFGTVCGDALKDLKSRIEVSEQESSESLESAASILNQHRGHFFTDPEDTLRKLTESVRTVEWKRKQCLDVDAQSAVSSLRHGDDVSKHKDIISAMSEDLPRDMDAGKEFLKNMKSKEGKVMKAQNLLKSQKALQNQIEAVKSKFSNDMPDVVQRELAVMNKHVAQAKLVMFCFASITTLLSSEVVGGIRGKKLTKSTKEELDAYATTATTMFSSDKLLAPKFSLAELAKHSKLAKDKVRLSQ